MTTNHTPLVVCPFCGDPMKVGGMGTMIEHVTQTPGCPMRDLSLPIERVADWNTRTTPEAATRLTTLEAEKAELVAGLEALDASWLETFPDGPEADYGLVSLGDEHKALWIRFRATLTKARQSEGEGK